MSYPRTNQWGSFSLMIRLFFWLLISVGSLVWKSHCAEVYTASVLPIEDVELSFPIDGILLKTSVKEGDRVKPGDALLSLDQRLQVLETNRRKLVWEDSSKLDTQRKMDKILKESLEATRSLYDRSGSVSKDELMQQEIRYLSSQGTIESLLQSELREEIEYQISAEVLTQHTLHSPIEGIVTEIKPDPGERVRTDLVVLRIVNSSKCLLEMNVPISDLPKFRSNSPLVIQSHNSKGTIKREAKIVFISPIADRGSSLVLVKAEFENKDMSITPGSTVQVSFAE